LTRPGLQGQQTCPAQQGLRRLPAAHAGSTLTATAAALLAAVATLAPDLVRAEAARAPTLTVELGAAWQARNDARISNEPPNTRFAIDEITGSGPYAAGRIALEWPLAERHVVRLLAAPLSIDETGTSDRTIPRCTSRAATGSSTAAPTTTTCTRLRASTSPCWR